MQGSQLLLFNYHFLVSQLEWIHTIRNSAVVCFLKESIGCKGVGDASMCRLNQSVFVYIVETLVNVRPCPAIQVQE
jgi:hypothetical protein